ncbi:uncharacterized protein LOC123632937 isoform X1 [Lemur catta]|uniref:uncharacterized protein LOC123632937 isoform X1 n=1 Tax=Lemur catta TaxID=9447 RepID=UPI001E26748F|nr:uncharacterized protein LOC123632937 isoform X1 [Lemur catta]
MKILAFFSILFFFGVYILPVCSPQRVTSPVIPLPTRCTLNLKKLPSMSSKFSTILERAQYGTEENNTDNPYFFRPFYYLISGSPLDIPNLHRLTSLQDLSALDAAHPDW